MSHPVSLLNIPFTPLAVLVMALLGGCAKDNAALVLAPEAQPVAAQVKPAPAEPVVRYGRYTLVSTKPALAQQDLLAQIVDTRIPADMQPTVYQAMQHVLRYSGYSLCQTTDKAVSTLYSRPLPAAHYRLGPVTLRSALQLLAGHAFALQVDEIERQICFTVRADYVKSLPSVNTPIATADVNFPAQSEREATRP